MREGDVPPPAWNAEAIAKYALESAKKMPLQPAIQRVKCLLRMPNKRCDDPLLKDSQKLVWPWPD